VPQAPPSPIDARGLLAYVSLAQLEATLPPAPKSTAAPGAVTVTALVLPTVSITVDARGRPIRIVVNTMERASDRLGFSVRREGSVAPIVPDAAAWQPIRDALAHTRAGVGIVWGA
jgi:hypothetical protein